MGESRLDRARSFLRRAVASLEDPPPRPAVPPAATGGEDRSATRSSVSTSVPAQASAASRRLTQSRISTVIGERNRLFHFNARGKDSCKAPNPKRKKRASVWTHDFICLARTGMTKPPSSLEAGELLRAGLGKKHLAFFEMGDSSDVHAEILDAFPQLSDGGGYELLRVGDTGGQRSQLRVIPPPSEGYTVNYLREVLRQAKVYVRPLQRDLPLTIDNSCTSVSKVNYSPLLCCMLARFTCNFKCDKVRVPYGCNISRV